MINEFWWGENFGVATFLVPAWIVSRLQKVGRDPEFGTTHQIFMRKWQNAGKNLKTTLTAYMPMKSYYWSVLKRLVD